MSSETNGVQLMEVVGLIALFVVAQVALEKGRAVQDFVMKLSLTRTLLFSIAAIALSIIVGALAGFPSEVVAVVTVVSSSAVAYRYRKSFERIETGKEGL